MICALADDLIDRTACLALIDKEANTDLYNMTNNSLHVRRQQYSLCSVDIRAVSPAEQNTVTPWSRVAGQSHSLPALPPCLRASNHSSVSMVTLSEESDHDAQQYLSGSLGSSASVAHFF